MSSWPPPQRPASPYSYISQTRYMPGLDGLRALAVMAVMIYHADHEWLSGGFLGVEVFFVISGYLITLLLIAEHERSDRINLVQFWKRRFRRLLPALFVMLALLAVYVTVWYRRPAGRTRGDFIGGLVYGSNWYQIVVGQSYTATEAFAPLRHLWSLAVEEHFYLIWPIVMVFILRKGRARLPRVALWLFAASAAIAVAVGVLYVGGDVADACGVGSSTNGYATILGHCINVNDALYLSTVTRAGGLLLGAAFAMVWRPLALLRGPMRNKGHLLDVFAVIGLAVLVLFTLKLQLSSTGSSFGSHYDPWLFRGGFFLTGLATLAIIAAVVHRRATAGRVLGNPVLTWIGTRSYGLYLYHWPIYQIIRKFAGVPLTLRQFILAMVITVPVTELSYRLVETPIRTGKLRAWIRSEHRSADADRHKRRLVGLVAITSMLVGFAGVSIAVAKNVCVGDVECSVEAGAAAEAANAGHPGPVAVPVTVPVTESTAPGTPTTISSDAPGAAGHDPSDTTPTTIPTDPTATTVAPAVDPAATAVPDPTATTVPAPPIDTTPTTAPPATAAPTTAPPAASTIQPIALGESVMLGALPNLQAGGFYVDAVVGRQGSQMADLVESLRANNQIGQTIVIQTGTNGSISSKDLQRIMAQLPPNLTPTVVFLTVRVPKPWQDANNALIRALPQSYPNVQVLDWQTQSMSITICSDGTHIACGGTMAQFYANLIFDQIGRPDLER
ncbi:MAG: putative acyltransferase [Ilumatobacteraceae bacterium]|nr:putative acyltransferase [Ilumatobacteraceae bacterium]